MRSKTLRILTGCLAGLLALSGMVAAQAPSIEEAQEVAGTTGAEAGLYPDSGYGDLDTATTLDDHSAATDSDGTLAEDHLWSEHGVASTAGAASATGGLYDEGNYGDLDAAATTEQAGAFADSDASVAEPDDEKGLWAWLSLRWDAFVTKLNEAASLAGVEAPSLDGGADVFVSEEGVDADATVAGIDLEETPAGNADDATWQILGEGADASAEAHASANATVQAVVG